MAVILLRYLPSSMAPSFEHVHCEGIPYSILFDSKI